MLLLTKDDCTTSTVGRVTTNDELNAANRHAKSAMRSRHREANARRLQLREWRGRHGSPYQLDGAEAALPTGPRASIANLRNGVEGPVRLVLVGPASVTVEP